MSCEPFNLWSIRIVCRDTRAIERCAIGRVPSATICLSGIVTSEVDSPIWHLRLDTHIRIVGIVIGTTLVKPQRGRSRALILHSLADIEPPDGRIPGNA